MGVLPAGYMANAVPERIQTFLNIDFVPGRKKRSGGNCRAAVRARHKLPGRGKFCRVTRQILPLVENYAASLARFFLKQGQKRRDAKKRFGFKQKGRILRSALPAFL
jgi:hypothetical protein